MTTWKEFVAAQNAPLGIKAPSPRPKVEIFQYLPENKAPAVQVTPEKDLGSLLASVSEEPNGLEKKYGLFLEQRRICGEILTWKFSAMKLKLAKATFYNIDFLVVMPDMTIELHETKGFARDDWRVKHKVAVEMFPWFKFVVVKWNKNTKDWEFKNG